MDAFATIPPAAVFYSPPMRGRMAPLGLGPSAGVLLYGGLPSNPSLSELSGDAGEGRDVPVRIQRPGLGDDSYRPHPNLPSANALDYVQKASISTLLVFGLALLVGLAIIRPQRAFGLLSRGAQHHAGMR